MKTKKTNEYLAPTTRVLPFQMEQMICVSVQSSTTDDFILEDNVTFDQLF